MINLKDKKINSVFLGNKKINKVLLGNKVVFSGEIVKYLNLGNMELCKIGEYQDYFYKQNGKWYKHTTIIKNILNGSENGWYISHSGDEYWAYRLSIDLRILAISAAQKGYSNLYGRTDINNSNTNQGIFYSYNNKQVCIRYGTEDTIENFKTFLSNNNLIIYGIAETPTDIEITDSNLINQLEELYQALPYGTATVESEPDYVPLIIDNNMVKGNTSQESTTGKNKYYGTANSYSFTAPSKTWYFINGDYGAYGSDIGTKTLYKAKVEQGKTYLLKGIANANAAQIVYSNEYIIKTNFDMERLANGVTFTANRNDDVILRLQCLAKTNITVSEIQLEEVESEQSTATDYEPYTGGQPSPNPDYPQSIKNGGGNNKITII